MKIYKKNIIWVIIIVLMIVALGYWQATKSVRLDTYNTPIQENEMPISASTSDWKTYTGTTSFGTAFALKYPASWVFFKYSCNTDGVAFWPETIAPTFSGAGCGMESFINSAPIILDTESKVELRLKNNDYKAIYTQFILNISTQPSITVLSPNGGENWKIGEKRNILYKVNDTTPKGYRVILYLDEEKKEIGFIDPGNPNSFIWTVGCYFGVNQCSKDIGEHKIKAMLFTGHNLISEDDSDSPFTITN